MNGRQDASYTIVLPASTHYILNDKREVVKADDLMQWAVWMESADRHVAFTEYRRRPSKRVYAISPVFLGIDHGFNFSEWKGEYQPILFETMVYFRDQVSRGGDWLDFQRRYRTYAEAEWGHWDAVKRLGNGTLYE